MKQRFLQWALLLIGAAPLIVSAQPAVRAAGCYLPLAQGVVVVEGRLEVQLQLPFGRRQGRETATEAAARETMEETGLAVVVGEEVARWPERGAVLFRCQVQGEVDLSRLRARDSFEIARVLVIDPERMTDHNGRRLALPWRYPDNLPLIRNLYSREAGVKLRRERSSQ